MKTSLKYLEHAYVPATTQHANRLPQWHPFRYLRMGSKGHAFMNSVQGSALDLLRDLRAEEVNNLFLPNARTDEISSMWGITPAQNPGRTAESSRNMLKNSAFEYAPRVNGVAWQWSVLEAGGATVEPTIDKALYGGRCLKAVVPVGGSATIVQSLNNLKARQNISLSLWYDGANVLAGSDGLRIYLVGDKVSDGSTIVTNKALALGNSEGRFYRLTGTVSFLYDVDNVYFVINIANASSSTITYYLDGAQAEMGVNVTPYRINYNDAPWFVDTEAMGPYDIFFMDGYKQRVIYCDSFDDLAFRACPTRATIAAISDSLDLRITNKVHSYKVEFDKSIWTTELRIDSNQVIRVNSQVPAEVFASYDLYELQDDDTMAVNATPELLDLGIIGELLFVLAKEDDQYVLKICNPEMAEPEVDKLYVINTIPISDPLNILSETVTGIQLLQAFGRDDIMALKVTYEDEIDVQLGLELKYDYYMYDETARQILARENYNLSGGLIVV